MIELRDYQSAAVQSLFDWWAAGRTGEDPLVCLPTGGGKTIVFAALIQRLMHEYPGVSILILAHRKELISQAEAKLLSVWPEAPCGVYAASLGRREIRPITIASRDTIARVIEHVGQFTFVIIDEAHRMSVKDEGQYRTLIGKLRERYEHLVVIGFTATPFRLGQGRIYGPGKPFADLAYRIGMIDLIKAGHLAPLTSMSASTGVIDTEGVRTTAGDFNEKQLEERATADGLIAAAIDEWHETAYLAGRRASVFFAVSIKHAELIRDAIRAKGIQAECVHGKLAHDEREHLLAAFDRGDYPALVNVAILIEGWDSPRVDCVVMMRPTQSSALYCQQVGRGLRLFPGKHDCLVLDFSGNIERLGPVDEADEKEPRGKKSDQEEVRCGTWNIELKAFEDGCGHLNPPNTPKCLACGKILIGKPCPKCGEKNLNGAKECAFCGELLVTHDGQAKRGGIVSTERAFEDFPVERLSWRVAVSQSSGRPYLRIAYHCGLFEVFYKNLMLGYPGYAGQKAVQEWAMLTTTGSTPEDAQHAADMLDFGEEQLKTPSAITVDVASRWKEIVRFDFTHGDSNVRSAA